MTQEKEQQEPGQPQADRVEVFGMNVKVFRSGDAVRAAEAGDKVTNRPSTRQQLLCSRSSADCV